MPGNKARCATLASDGSVLIGTNDGLAVIKDGKVVRTVTGSDIIENTVFLTVCEGDDGIIYAGSDGDGIYVIDGEKVTRLSRPEGLSSDVILRIKKDEANGVYWIITSNSIECMKNGNIKRIDSFPYNNNFEIIPDHENNLWVMSSQGVYVVDADDAVNDAISGLT